MDAREAQRTLELARIKVSRLCNEGAPDAVIDEAAAERDKAAAEVARLLNPNGGR